MSDLSTRVAEVRARIARAAATVGRDPSAVKLLAVSKQQSADRVLEGVAAGLHAFGENRVQEAAEKIPVVRAACATPLEWHLIGGLQRNKARRAVELCDVIQSVDRPELLLALDKAAHELGRRPRIFLQVNIDREQQKSGCMPSTLAALAEAADRCANLELVGLMAIPRVCDNAEQVRPSFARLRGLLAELNRTRPREQQLSELSMGMTGDFEVAVQEGATWLRIGTALFGERQNA
jgi:pyridoxal phosphate enzyme (YggS family)